MKKKKLETIIKCNDYLYDSLALSRTERRYVTTTDGKKMLVWVILPPNFDATKNTQPYCIAKADHNSIDTVLLFPLEFPMAANGYIVVAPNRHGMPGQGRRME
jgi:dipeptidyl aminopeptidase/acylaminoacyl peptidase